MVVGPQIGKVSCGGLPHLSCKRDQIKIGEYMDRRVTPPKRVTSPPCKQALKENLVTWYKLTFAFWRKHDS